MVETPREKFERNKAEIAAQKKKSEKPATAQPAETPKAPRKPRAPKS